MTTSEAVSEMASRWSGSLGPLPNGASNPDPEPEESDNEELEPAAGSPTVVENCQSAGRGAQGLNMLFCGRLLFLRSVEIYAFANPSYGCCICLRRHFRASPGSTCTGVDRVHEHGDHTPAPVSVGSEDIAEGLELAPGAVRGWVSHKTHSRNRGGI